MSVNVYYDVDASVSDIATGQMNLFRSFSDEDFAMFVSPRCLYEVWNDPDYIKNNFKKKSNKWFKQAVKGKLLKSSIEESERDFLYASLPEDQVQFADMMDIEITLLEIEYTELKPIDEFDPETASKDQMAEAFIDFQD